MVDKFIVGRRIQTLRKELGYSQSIFAEKLNVSTQAVSKWETGLALPDNTCSANGLRSIYLTPLIVTSGAGVMVFKIFCANV